MCRVRGSLVNCGETRITVPGDPQVPRRSLPEGVQANKPCASRLHRNLAMISARPALKQFRRTCADSPLHFSGVSNTNESTGCTQVCDDCASTARPGCATFIDNPLKVHLFSTLLLNTLILAHRKRSLKPVSDNMAHGQPVALSIVGSESWDICRGASGVGVFLVSAWHFTITKWRAGGLRWVSTSDERSNHIHPVLSETFFNLRSLCLKDKGSPFLCSYS
jgi:hypothetical protein